ncbi:hypothetical protein O9992_22640 [Vibrio lentus]|nr:hypothetical protein [Vibrio lentus]
MKLHQLFANVDFQDLIIGHIEIDNRRTSPQNSDVQVGVPSGRNDGILHNARRRRKYLGSENTQSFVTPLAK